MFSVVLSRIFLFLSLCFCCSVNVWGFDLVSAASKLDSTVLEDITITTGRRAESIRELPSSVTILSKKDLRNQILINTDISSSLSYLVPGMGGYSYLNIGRGQTLRGRQVLVLIDGIPQTTPLLNVGRDLRSIDPAAIERVEVVKGATAIYGNGADGGVINYITRRLDRHKPVGGTSTIAVTGQPYKYIGGTAGMRVSQFLSSNIKKWDYSVSFVYEGTGHIKDTKGQYTTARNSLAQMNMYSGLLRLGYQFTEQQRLDVMYYVFASRSFLELTTTGVGKYGISPEISVPLLHREGFGPGTPKNHNIQVTYSNKRIFKNTSFTTNLYFQDFKTLFEYDPFTYIGGGQLNTVAKKFGFRLNFFSDLWRTKNTSADMLYGADVLNDNTVQKVEQDGRNRTPYMNMTNISIFALVKIKLFDKLILKFGGRCENARITVSDFHTLPRLNARTSTYPSSVFVTGGILRYQAFMGNFGIRYNVHKTFNLFAHFSQGFSVNDLGRSLRETRTIDGQALPTLTVGNFNFKPIIVNNYELGIAGQVGRWLSYEAAGYVSTSKLGSSIRDIGSVFVIVRQPEIVYGVDGKLVFKPVKPLELGFLFTYVEGKISPKDDGKYTAYLNGARIPPAKIITYIGARPLKNWYIRVMLLYSFGRNRFQKNDKGKYNSLEGKVPPYIMLALNTSYKVYKNLELALGIENLANRYYYSNFAWYQANNRDFAPIPGIRGMFSVRYSF